MKPGVANTLIYGIDHRLAWLESTVLPRNREWFRNDLRQVEESIEYCESLGANLSRQRSVLASLKKSAADHGPDPAA